MKKRLERVEEFELMEQPRRGLCRSSRRIETTTEARELQVLLGDAFPAERGDICFLVGYSYYQLTRRDDDTSHHSEQIWNFQTSEYEVVPSCYKLENRREYYQIILPRYIESVRLYSLTCPVCKVVSWVIDKSSKLCSNCLLQRSYDCDEYKYRYLKYAGRNQLSWGIELELAASHRDPMRYQDVIERCIKSGFLRTADSTVEDEMKSPIYTVDYVPGNLKKLLTDAARFTQDGNVGTHVNIGSIPRWNTTIRHHMPQIFGALERHMALHESQTMKIWGRWFGPYRTFPMSGTHGSWIVAHTDRLEFRLPKLRDYKQFSQLVKWLLTTIKHIFNRTRDGCLVNDSEFSVLGDEVLTRYIAHFGYCEEDNHSLYAAYTVYDSGVSPSSFLDFESYSDLADEERVDDEYEDAEYSEESEYDIYSDTDESSEVVYEDGEIVQAFDSTPSNGRYAWVNARRIGEFIYSVEDHRQIMHRRNNGWGRYIWIHVEREG